MAARKKHSDGQDAAETKRGVSRPNDWDKAISVAYLRMIGHTQEEAAKGAGVGIRTSREWERSLWWLDAATEAQWAWATWV